ncbi:hypothetical protein L21_1155 [Methanoculleus chikugoensis]|jgi:hypothetical protein|uniref:Uncharacterized protein n=1 Tax=Methanoculleus chikugoensis TaxID=118126 RepID=A0A1M4MK04_9EURY|nr:hypothetical protein [Methanoculleus chikugoensis]MDD4566295.1 hypothetical protein [Methanoculleus chikugoensis]NMA09595.1 hypothetical protein [Methanomicrobiales archaeon]BBL67941.1 hypothetical protein MchiMG62_11220 [Methanoculleus chikugoensis]SCL75261.1 hypothetical protein L21_1155 [Methanoculleus chikugoensis]
MAEEELYDMLVPPGVPRKMIYDVAEKFDVEVVRRQQRLSFANMDGDARELIAFRGKREVVEEVQEYLFARLKEFVAE